MLLLTVIMDPVPADVVKTPPKVPVVAVAQVAEDDTVFPVIETMFGFPASPPVNPQVIPVIPEVRDEEVSDIILFLISPQEPEIILIPKTVLVEPVPLVIVLLFTFKPRWLVSITPLAATALPP